MTPAFRRVGRLVQGYDVQQVDQFFRRAGGPAAVTEGSGLRGPQRQARAAPPSRSASLESRQVRLTAFRLRRHGYDVAQVDEALDALEDQAATDERERLVAGQGDEALLRRLGSLAATLDARLARAPGTRFRRGRRVQRTYDPVAVDALCDRIAAYLGDGAPMSVDEVRRAVFRSRRGRRGYREADVDAFLDRAVTIMLAVG